MTSSLAVVATFLSLTAGPVPTQATQAPTLVVDSSKLDIRLDDMVRPGAWSLSEGKDPDVLTVPIATRGGVVEACLASGAQSHCQSIRTGDQHDFIVMSAGKAYPIRFQGVFQPPMAVFDPDYQAQNRGQIRADIPEVYELVNIAFALTDQAQAMPGMIYTNSPYHAEVLAAFDGVRDHPFVLGLNTAMRTEILNYFHLKMNGYAFVFDGDDQIVASPIYNRSGFNGRPQNDLEPYLSQMQDFADKSGFRRFYADHQTLYRSQVDYFKNDVDLAGMQAWLQANFPAIKPYDTTNIIFSPLVFRNQSLTWMTSNGFSELQPHVNFPYPDVVEAGLSSDAAALRRGYIVFTEINHGFINPTAETYGQRFGQAIGDRTRWARPGSPSDSYASNTSLFNELMNWALVSLYVIDKAPEAEHAKMLANLDVYMTEQRGFTDFPAFNAFLVDIYRKRAPGTTVADLYPQIIDWVAARSES